MTGTAKTKLFTVDKANQMLPLVRAIVSDIVELYQDVRERQERFDHLRQRHGYFSQASRDEGNVYSEERQHIEDELNKDRERLRNFIVELEELGVELKDPVVGLVDFPTVVEGRKAYLCWKLGEPEIGFWHDLDAGFSGRQSLLEGSVPGENTSDEDQG